MGFFGNKFPPDTSLDIIKYVQEAYYDYSKEKINYIWLSLMQHLNGILESHGDNDYIIDRLGKEKLERQNNLPHVLGVASGVDLSYLENS